jgi:hypothetical protein
VHGKGVFAVRPIAAGETIIEYTGELISLARGAAPPSARPGGPEPHLLLPRRRPARHRRQVRRQRRALDQPRLRPELRAEEAGRPRLHQGAAQHAAGEELNYDYGLVIDERYTPKLKAEYPCWCGSPACRGTMLAPKRR